MKAAQRRGAGAGSGVSAHDVHPCMPGIEEHIDTVASLAARDVTKCGTGAPALLHSRTVLFEGLNPKPMPSQSVL